VAASVNMLGCPSAIEGAFPYTDEYDDQDDNDTKKRAPSLFAFMQNIVSVEEIESFQTELNQANIAAQKEYTAAYNKHKADVDTSTKQKRLLKELENKHGKIDVEINATEEQMQAMSDTMWEALMRYTGLCIIQNRINDILEPLKTAQTIQEGIDFIALWSKKDTADRKDISVFTSVLYQICLGLADATLAQMKIDLQFENRKEKANDACNAIQADLEKEKNADASPKYTSEQAKQEAFQHYDEELRKAADLTEGELAKKIIEELRAMCIAPLRVSDREKIHLEYGKVLSFMQTTCSGTPPYKWYNMARRSLSINPIIICKILFIEPANFLNQYTPQPFVGQPFLTLNSSSIYSKHMIMDGYSAYNKLSDKLQTDTSQYNFALAYALFTNDVARGVSTKWKTS